MKKILIILILGVIMVLSSCHPDNDDYMTQAFINLDTSDTLTIERVQAMAQITNLNTRHIVTTSDFTEGTVQIELLRGAYQISIEGVMRYSDQQGEYHVRSFRAISDYVELTGLSRSYAELKIIFLD